MSNPPAPADDATLAAAPDFIVPGTWDDAGWRAVAAKQDADMTEADKYLYVGGPRLHPWGNAAYTGRLETGEDAVFPSKAAYDAHTGAAQKTDTAKGAAGINALNAGLAAGSTEPTN